METRITSSENGWICGEHLGMKFVIKAYEEESKFGIEEGKISKMEIRKGSTILCAYDRGWEIDPSEECMDLYETLIDCFN